MDDENTDCIDEAHLFNDQTVYPCRRLIDHPIYPIGHKFFKVITLLVIFAGINNYVF